MSTVIHMCRTGQRHEAVDGVHVEYGVAQYRTADGTHYCVPLQSIEQIITTEEDDA